jgi:hypothetical protein
MATTETEMEQQMELELVVDTKLVTPEWAMMILKHFNMGNRRIRKAKVARYARDMTDGHWMTTHQGIAFDKHGKLIDGQHRLMAVVESGMSVKMITFRDGMSGELEGTGMVIDDHEARSPADFLSLSGEFGMVSPMAGSILRQFLRGVMPYTTPLTHTELTDAYREYRVSIEFAAGCFARAKARLTGAHIRSVIARAHFHGEDQEYLKGFCDVLLDPASATSWTIAHDNPVVRLRDALMMGKSGTALRSVHIYRLTQSALKHWLAGTVSLSRLNGAAVDCWPLPGQKVWTRYRGPIKGTGRRGTLQSSDVRLTPSLSLAIKTIYGHKEGLTSRELALAMGRTSHAARNLIARAIRHGKVEQRGYRSKEESGCRSACLLYVHVSHIKQAT